MPMLTTNYCTQVHCDDQDFTLARHGFGTSIGGQWEVVEDGPIGESGRYFEYLWADNEVMISPGVCEHRTPT